MIKILSVFMLLSLGAITIAQKSTGFSLVEKKDKKQVDILYNNKLLTSYCNLDSSKKPVLFPVNTIDGITITRSYPYKLIAGERTDHPHHTGIWLNYESVNGLDFWNNSTAIPVEKRDHYGTIIHQEIVSKKANGDKASLVATAIWVRPDNKVLLDEQSTFNFRADPKENNFIIDRITTLTAKDTVEFKDVKDGMFAIRVARELELPSKEKTSFVDNNGIVTTVPPSAGDVTGMYYSSNGLKGDSVWGTKGEWVKLTGKKDGKDITIGMFDHPLNVGYPTYWHARGYGLFALNPLGRKVFSNGKEELNLTLHPGTSVTFRYRVVVHSGKFLTTDDMNKLSADFKSAK